MDTADDIKRIIAKSLKLDPSSLTMESRFSDLAADSLDVIEIVFTLEEKYNIDLVLEAKEKTFLVQIKQSGDLQMAEFNTVGDVVRTVQQIVDAKAS